MVPAGAVLTGTAVLLRTPENLWERVHPRTPAQPVPDTAPFLLRPFDDREASTYA